MKYLLSLALLVCIQIDGQAQWGLHAGYSRLSTLNSDDTDLGYTLSEDSYSGWTAGLDYWFRLKEKRIEFLPTLSVSQLSQQNQSAIQTLQLVDVEDQLNLYSFSIPISFYFLDFEGDCNCPTFSKGGNFFQKGFFVQVIPAVTYFDTQLKITDTNTTIEDEFVALGIGAGIGLDIGISDLITLTPMVRFSVNQRKNRDNLAENSIYEDIELSHTQSIFALRVGFRFDE